MDTLALLSTALVAYLVGSLPMGYLIGRLWGVNVLGRGSGRTGGANVFRSVGPVPALLTGALDVGKGALAVWLAILITGRPLGEALAGAAAILGHNNSIFLGFRGGAGVGTSLGALAMIYFPAGAGLVVILLVVIAATRYASLGSLVVVTLMPIVLLVLGVTHVLPLIFLGYGLVAWVLIVHAHRANIRRLLAGTERRLGSGEPLGS